MNETKVDYERLQHLSHQEAYDETIICLRKIIAISDIICVSDGEYLIELHDRLMKQEQEKRDKENPLAHLFKRDEKGRRYNIQTGQTYEPETNRWLFIGCLDKDGVSIKNHFKNSKNI